MGTEYFLARPDNETLFELGKGLINGAFDDTAEGATFHLPHRLRSRIKRALVDYADDGKDWGDYAAFVTKKIRAWAQGQPVQFISEHDDRAYAWERTGSRYLRGS